MFVVFFSPKQKSDPGSRPLWCPQMRSNGQVPTVTWRKKALRAMREAPGWKHYLKRMGCMNEQNPKNSQKWVVVFSGLIPRISGSLKETVSWQFLSPFACCRLEHSSHHIILILSRSFGSGNHCRDESSSASRLWLGLNLNIAWALETVLYVLFETDLKKKNIVYIYIYCICSN